MIYKKRKLYNMQIRCLYALCASRFKCNVTILPVRGSLIIGFLVIYYGRTWRKYDTEVSANAGEDNKGNLSLYIMEKLLCLTKGNTTADMV